MGISFYNWHVRTNDAAAVKTALHESLKIAAYVSDVYNGWVSVYPHTMYGDIEAVRLSAALSLPVLYLWEYHDDVAGYHLYENGVLRDGYESDPDYWVGDLDENGDEIQPKTPEELERLRGIPDALLGYCLPGTTVDTIAVALAAHNDVAMYATEVMMRLSELLGLPWERLDLNFHHIGAGDGEFARELIGAEHLPQEERDDVLKAAIQ